jgi:hypothetical protein
MLRISGLLAVGILLLGFGSVSASVPTSAGSQVGRSAIVHLAQYDGGRCFNRCVTGRIFRRCQNDAEAEKENCCSWACTRFNNRYYSEP